MLKVNHAYCATLLVAVNQISIRVCEKGLNIFNFKYVSGISLNKTCFILFLDVNGGNSQTCCYSLIEIYFTVQNNSNSNYNTLHKKKLGSLFIKIKL